MNTELRREPPLLMRRGGGRGVRTGPRPDVSASDFLERRLRCLKYIAPSRNPVSAIIHVDTDSSSGTKLADRFVPSNASARDLRILNVQTAAALAEVACPLYLGQTLGGSSLVAFSKQNHSGIRHTPTPTT